MSLKADTSLAIGLATGTLVYAIHQNLTPSIADIRSLESANSDVRASERVATWTSAAVVAGISLLAKDATIFIIGGAVTIAMAWTTRHADLVDTVTKRASAVDLPTLSEIGNTPSGVTGAPPQERVSMAYGSSVI